MQVHRSDILQPKVWLIGKLLSYCGLMNKPESALVTPPSRLVLTPAQVQAEYGFPVNTLKYWRYRGIGPNYIKTGESGGVVRYRREVIEAWLDDRTVETQAALLLPGRPWGRRRSGWGPPSPRLGVGFSGAGPLVPDAA